MVITVTLNPAVDKTLYLDKLKVGKVNRVVKMRQDIGGKGINVSKVLNEFNIDSICTGFLGKGYDNEFKNELDKMKIRHDFVHIMNNNRVNTKIVDKTDNSNTDINEAGPSISSEELKQFIEKFEKICKKDYIVVLSGSVGPSIPDDIYGTLTKIAKSKGALVIIDAEGKLLEEGIKEIPHLVKPNVHELESILKRPLLTHEDIIKGGEDVVKMGVKQVLISLGKEGSMLVSKDEAIYAKGIDIPTMSTVGAGDSMVAALVYSIINGYSNKETLAFAQGSGTATVMLEGTEACKLEDAEKFAKQALLDIKYKKLTNRKTII